MAHTLKGKIKLITLNIEHSKHFARFIPFVRQQTPDILLLQEVYRGDLDFIQQQTGLKCCAFIGNNYLQDDGVVRELGVATFSNHQLQDVNTIYYRGDRDNLPLITNVQPELMARALLITDFLINNKKYCVINTHFSWSKDGEATSLQQQDMQNMLAILEDYPQCILCGDFNAPRGLATHAMLTQRFKDNVPKEITSTLDPVLHKLQNSKQLVVDGIFTTKHYMVEDLKMVSGVSDHCALVAKVV